MKPWLIVNGRGRRLPTEAEWEFAAAMKPNPNENMMSSEKRRFPWGNANPSSERVNMDWGRMGCIDVSALPESDSAFGCRQMIGNVWEWTVNGFQPYPGFVRDAYKEYSEPWIGTHKILRGWMLDDAFTNVEKYVAELLYPRSAGCIGGISYMCVVIIDWITTSYDFRSGAGAS